MVIEIDLRAAPANVELSAPHDFSSFTVVAHGSEADRDDLADAVNRIGRMASDGHVFVDVGALQALAGSRARQGSWLASLDGMLRYADEQGWTDDSGAIQAHVQWTA